MLYLRTFLYNFARICIGPFARPFVPTIIKGKENFPASGKVIVCANHLGISDAIRLVIHNKRQIFFMSKSELFENKPLAWLLRSLGCFPVQRGKRDVNAIDHGGEILKRGDPMGIFIEGTRSRDGSFGQPKAGAVMIAHANDAPILPVCITPVGSPLPRMFHKVILSYGELIPPEKLGIEKGTGTEYRNACRMVMGKIQAMRERDLKEMKP